MRTWHRVTFTTGLLALAVALGGCRDTGTASPATPSNGTAVSSPTPGGSAAVPPPVSTSSPASTTPPPPAGTGLTGRITVDGGCPVITDRGCPDRPYPGRITVLAPGSTQAMATALAATDGTYRIALAPGQYVLHVSSVDGKPFPRAASVTVTVTPGHYATANVRLDTGIR